MDETTTIKEGVMTEEMKKLQKEINGKVVVYENRDGDKFDVILLWSPYGKQVSVKPYGYTEDELFNALQKADYDFDKQYVTRPEFCLVSVFINDKNKTALFGMAKLEEGKVFNMNTVAGYATDSPFSPSCPYG